MMWGPLLLLMVCCVVTQCVGQQLQPQLPRRFIVMLETQPTANHDHHNNNRRSIEEESARIQQEQEELLSALALRKRDSTLDISLAEYTSEDGTSHDLRFSRYINALTLSAESTADSTATILETLQALPHVASVHVERQHKQTLWTSVPQIGASLVSSSSSPSSAWWAGKGVKVAIVDGGLFANAPMMNATGFSWPSSQFKGDKTNCNAKVIASRAYFNSQAPPYSADRYTYPYRVAHGVHVSSTAAGTPVTHAIGNTKFQLQGVAPGAYVMNYKIFYYDNTGSSSGGYDSEVLAALQDAADDGADVISNSWGSYSYDTSASPVESLVTQLVKRNITVVFAAGNDGPSGHTVDHACTTCIRVGAVTSAFSLITSGVLQSKPPVSSEAISYAVTELTGAPSSAFSLPLVLPPANNLLGCSAFTSDLSGKAVLVKRGTCLFSQKIQNAKAAKSSFVVVYNNEGDDTLIAMAGTAVISGMLAVFVGGTTGQRLVSIVTANPQNTTIGISFDALKVARKQDAVASFSSRGPDSELHMSPDLAAPGVEILAAGYGTSTISSFFGYGRASGTSMATPHVAGAAAVLKSVHPSWTPAEIKSALMSTALFNITTVTGFAAQPTDSGAGRILVPQATASVLFFEPQSLNFGRVLQGSTVSKVMTVTPYSSLPTSVSVTIAQNLLSGVVGYPSVTVTPSVFTAIKGVPVTLTITLTAAATRSCQDIGVHVVFNTQPQHHVPLFGRVVYNEKSQKDVLLVDLDYEDCANNNHPTLALYKTALPSSLSVEAITPSCTQLLDSTFSLPTTDLQFVRHKLVVIFTGKVMAASLASRVPALRAYVQTGGKLLVMGSAAATMFLTSTSYTVTGYISEEFLSDILGTIALVKSLNSTAATATTTAPQAWQYVSVPLTNPSAMEIYNPTKVGIKSIPLLQDSKGRILAVGSISDPLSTQLVRTFKSGAAFVSFGLESVTTRSKQAELMQHLYSYLTEELPEDCTLSIWPTTNTKLTLMIPSTAVGFRATSMTVMWGDGSEATTKAITAKAIPSITHSYASAGMHTVTLVIGSSQGRSFSITSTQFYHQIGFIKQ